MSGMGGQIGNWAGGGATTTLGAAQLLYGLYQQKHNQRPEYKIPDEVQQNLNQAKQQAYLGLPEAQKQQYLNNLQQSTAYSLNQNSSRRGGLTNIAALNQNQIQGQQNLLSMDAQANMQNRQGLMAQRQNMADYRDQAYQINQSNPYYEKTAQNNALIGAGMQNVSQGFQQGNTGGGGDYTKSVQAPQQQQYFTPNKGSETGMVNYGGGNSYVNNPNNGNWNYQGAQYDPKIA